MYGYNYVCTPIKIYLQYTVVIYLKKQSGEHNCEGIHSMHKYVQ
jgi:hypothetical protein